MGAAGEVGKLDFETQPERAQLLGMAQRGTQHFLGRHPGQRAVEDAPSLGFLLCQRGT